MNDGCPDGLQRRGEWSAKRQSHGQIDSKNLDSAAPHGRAVFRESGRPAAPKRGMLDEAASTATTRAVSNRPQLLAASACRFRQTISTSEKMPMGETIVENLGTATASLRLDRLRLWTGRKVQHRAQLKPGPCPPSSREGVMIGEDEQTLRTRTK